MGESLINYPAMLQRALLSLVRDVLTDTADVGLPGDHHLYISFSTEHPGVEMPATLRARYEEEMTIVLQNQFWDLEVAEESFSVTLRFDGVPAGLLIPFESIRSFVDPAASFGLKFELLGDDGDSTELEPGVESPEPSTEEKESSAPGAQILSFDRGRSRD